MRRRGSQHRCVWIAGWLLLLAACQEGATPTHIVLDVHVAKLIEARVTSVVVHSDKRSGAESEDDPEAKATFKAGQTPRFILQPATHQAQLQLRVVALHDREEIASALL